MLQTESKPQTYEISLFLLKYIMMSVTIDVVIPSFRLDAETLLPILNLQKPAYAKVKFYLVSDNPALTPPQSILEIVDNDNIFLITNRVNLGASGTRNKGLESGQYDWILFLDDDVEVSPDLLFIYSDAIKQYPGETGFIGLVNMPPPPTLFAKAVEVNGSMGIFNIAKQKPSFAWGATANFMINRSAVGDVRFADIYPKTGGGEEVEFFLKIRERNNLKNYKSLKNASTIHPWWGNGKTDFSRFFKYGIGNSFLGQRNKSYRWYDFLNTSETLLVITIVFLLTTGNHKANSAVILFGVATIIIEFILSVVRCYKATKKIDLKIAGYVMLLRNVYEMGILWGNLSRFRVAGMGERFSYDGNTKRNDFRFNRFKIIKLSLLFIALIIITVAIYT